MLFKEPKKQNIEVIYIADDEEKIIHPEPEVGKIYYCFNDGKINRFRLDRVKIIKKINLDDPNISKYLISILQKDINDCPWIWDLEQHNIYRAYFVDDEGKMLRRNGYCYFMKEKNSSTWFSARANFLCWGMLDTDNYFYNQMLKWEEDN